MSIELSPYRKAITEPAPVQFHCASCGKSLTLERAPLMLDDGVIPWRRTCACGGMMRRVTMLIGD